MTDEKMPRREHFECRNCGQHVASDEDGCCATCGEDVRTSECCLQFTDYDTLRELARAVVEADRAVEESAFEDDMDAVPLLAKRKFATVALRERLDATEKETPDE